MALGAERRCRRRGSLLFTHSSRRRFAARLNSGASLMMKRLMKEALTIRKVARIILFTALGWAAFFLFLPWLSHSGTCQSLLQLFRYQRKRLAARRGDGLQCPFCSIGRCVLVPCLQTNCCAQAVSPARPLPDFPSQGSQRAHCRGARVYRDGSGRSRGAGSRCLFGPWHGSADSGSSHPTDRHSRVQRQNSSQQGAADRLRRRLSRNVGSLGSWRVPAAA